MKGEAAAARQQTRPIKKTGESLRNAGKQELGKESLRSHDAGDGSQVQ